MSDLIGRKSVMDIIQDELNLRIGYDADVVLFSVKKRLSELPTAYDIGKVVRELERAKHEICLYGDDLEHYQNGIDEAIEIIKHGCVDDDVCEWKEIIGFDDMYIKNPHTNVLYINDTKRKNIYCNTCGKKIKVVD